MDDVIRCIILKNHLKIICAIEQIFGDPGESDCRLINPYLYENGELVKWLDEVTEQNEIEIFSSNILTHVEPKKEIIEKYLELTAE